MELEQEIKLVTKFLEIGVYTGGNGRRELRAEERPAYERTVELYTGILAALAGK